MSGLSLDWVMSGGIRRCLYRSTVIAQSQAVESNQQSSSSVFFLAYALLDKVDSLGCSLMVSAVLYPRTCSRPGPWSSCSGCILVSPFGNPGGMQVEVQVNLDLLETV